MKKCYLYCDPRSINDATNYYCGLIKQGLENEGYQYEIAHNLSALKDANVIFTITEKYFFKAKLRYPAKKHIYWAQGVDAEEAKMDMRTIKDLLRYLFRRLSEPMAVKLSDLLFCVSIRMLEYFEDTYGLKNRGQIIVMPCYNLQLSKKFNEKQYEEPTFVYAGGASIWQGVDFMLDVYSNIEKKLPTSRLTLLTKDKEVFINKLKEKGINNYEIKYISVSELQNELHKYKYGFILRDNSIVNQVATPTKMNSYLSNYLIPIFSTTVDDFNRHINLGEFSIKIQYPLDSKLIANEIIKFETESHDFSKYKQFVDNVFEEHYNDSVYLSEIKEKIERTVGV